MRLLLERCPRPYPPLHVANPTFEEPDAGILHVRIAVTSQPATRRPKGKPQG
jgi:hypothetical protein